MLLRTLHRIVGSALLAGANAVSPAQASSAPEVPPLSAVPNRAAIANVVVDRSAAQRTADVYVACAQKVGPMVGLAGSNRPQTAVSTQDRASFNRWLEAAYRVEAARCVRARVPDSADPAAATALAALKGALDLEVSQARGEFAAADRRLLEVALAAFPQGPAPTQAQKNAAMARLFAELDQRSTSVLLTPPLWVNDAPAR